jgi:hypothetical protein
LAPGFSFLDAATAGERRSHGFIPAEQGGTPFLEAKFSVEFALATRPKT